MQQKKILGRKRHLLVDTIGLLICVKVLTAAIRDREGSKVLLTSLKGNLPRLQLMWGDSGYAGEPFKRWVQEQLGIRFDIVNHPWTGIRGVWVREGMEVDWNTIIPPGFHVLPRRWVVERTNAWITHHRRLSRDARGYVHQQRSVHLSRYDQNHASSAGSQASLNIVFLHTL
jgi:transposase